MEPSSSVDAFVIEDLGQQKLQARYLTALVRRTGLRIRLIDLNDGVDAIVALAKRATPRLIVSSILFADRVDEILALMTALRGVCPRAHLALAGHLPAFASTELRAACPALDSISAQSLISNLDSLPFPARDDGIAAYLGYGFATVEASRGCYHACAFCLPSAFYRAHGAPYRLRGIANLVDEIEALYQQGARLFLFDDEQFLPPKPARAERVTAFADELARRDLRIAFTIKCRADDVDETLFRYLKEIGLLRVYVGIESGSGMTLELLNKRVTPQQNADALAMLDSLGIVADFHVLFFHPWSTLETIQTESAFLESILPRCSTAFDFCEVEIYPGTLFARRARAEGKCGTDAWQMPYTVADPRAELLRRLCRVVFGTLFAQSREALTRAWFAQLLARRFRPTVSDDDRARELKVLAARANREALAVWREMLTFADGEKAFDASRVNARASAWATRLDMLRR